MRKWRKMTWAMLAWVALIIVWIIAGAASADSTCDDEPAETRELCEAAEDVGTGIGVGIIVLIGFMGFIVLSIIWFMTRPKPEQPIQYVAVPAPSPHMAPPSRAAPPPPRSSKPAGWYRDPSGKFDWRWFDNGWTDHVSNEGDDTTFTDPVPH